MNKNSHLFYLSFFFLIVNCNCDVEDSQQGLIIDNFSFGKCNGFFYKNNKIDFEKEVVIKTKEECRALINELKLDTSESAEIPTIDFKKFTLIGKGVLALGCDVAFDRKFFKSENNGFIYIIKVKSKGDCDPGIFSMNYILVPKIDNNARVSFEVIN
jgi:hypothetical protein